MTKQCFKCKETLPLAMFYKHPQMADGRVNKCKECNKKDVKENRTAHIDYYLEYDRNRANNPDRVEARLKYSLTEGGKAAIKRGQIKWAATENGKDSIRISKAKWSESNVVRRAAQIIVGNAVRDKVLIKPKNCSSCGAEPKRLEGHHCDYAKPLDVLWLCRKCHVSWHKVNTPING